MCARKHTVFACHNSVTHKTRGSGFVFFCVLGNAWRGALFSALMRERNATGVGTGRSGCGNGNNHSPANSLFSLFNGVLLHQHQTTAHRTGAQRSFAVQRDNAIVIELSTAHAATVFLEYRQRNTFILARRFLICAHNIAR